MTHATLQPAQSGLHGVEPGSMTDEQLLLVLEHRMAEKRLTLNGAVRERVVEELGWYQRAELLLDRHMNQLAAQAYGGRHPKHWLWKQHKRFILDRVRPGERVLDVGCGASAYLMWMAEMGCRVTAMDNRREVLALARSIMSHPNLKFEERDATARPPDEPFDVVICSHVIEHVDEPVALLAALRRWAPRLMVAVPPSDNRWQKVMFRDLGMRWKDDEDHRREYTAGLLTEQIVAAGWKVTEMHAGVDIKAVAVDPEWKPGAASFIAAGASHGVNRTRRQESN